MKQLHAQLPHALIDYCNSLLYNQVQHCSTPKKSEPGGADFNRTPRDHITEVLINLHWLKVEQRIIYRILILTYKSFVDLSASLYLRELVKKKNKSANTRLADDSLLLVVLLISEGSFNTFF